MIEVTDKALQQLASREVGEGITVALMPGGCAGFEYKMDYIGERILDSNWTVLNYPTFKIAVDKMSIPYLEGSTLDWEQNGINEEFVFRNPNEQSRCGCGVSAIF
mgnify:CR=1 FL=1|jgi:iron-sulfur cluster assembly protein|tara:strand:- start:367 stop:681 length:315 start_codon:yes stop_codon:yes gene_type:complete